MLFAALSARRRRTHAELNEVMARGFVRTLPTTQRFSSRLAVRWPPPFQGDQQHRLSRRERLLGQQWHALTQGNGERARVAVRDLHRSLRRANFRSTFAVARLACRPNVIGPAHYFHLMTSDPGAVQVALGSTRWSSLCRKSRIRRSAGSAFFIPIAVAITGSVPRKKDNPAVPVTPAEQIESTQLDQ